MVSELPAMRTPTMNQDSFLLRGVSHSFTFRPDGKADQDRNPAKPSSSHLPTAPGASPFCHICLTNQTLIMNMLANYLPDEDVSEANPSCGLTKQDPTYRELYENLPTYLASVHARYPPVCNNCQPAVDEALKRADRRANVDAWGSALRRGHTSTSSDRSGWYEVLDIAFWRLRGLLFCCSAAVSLGLGLAGESSIRNARLPRLTLRCGVPRVG